VQNQVLVRKAFYQEVGMQRIQMAMNLFFFFLACPLLDILGISITFYLFIFASYTAYSKFGHWIDYTPDIINALIFLLLVASIISLINPPETLRRASFADDLKLLIQFIYWFSIVLFLKKWIGYLNKKTLIKYLGIGILCSSIYYFIFDGQLPFLQFLSQNGYAFMLTILWPILAYYIKSYYKPVFFYLLCMAVILLVSKSGSRAGAIIVSFQALLLIIASFKSIRRFLILTSVILLPVIIQYNIISFDGSSFQNRIAEAISPYNEEVAIIIRNPNMLQRTDRSWMTRQLMVQKALKIHEEYPIKGVGIGRFAKIWQDLDMQEYRAKALNIEKLNRRSSHNSYAKWLAETGYIGMIPLVVLILLTFVKIIQYLAFDRNFNLIAHSGVGLLGSIFYLYVISVITGAIFWASLGVFWSLDYIQKQKRAEQ
jgi:O-antigen ligase